MEEHGTHVRLFDMQPKWTIQHLVIPDTDFNEGELAWLDDNKSVYSRKLRMAVDAEVTANSGKQVIAEDEAGKANEGGGADGEAVGPIPESTPIWTQ